MEKSQSKRHKLFFSRTDKLNYLAFAGLNHLNYGKRRVRGVSSTISPLMGGVLGHANTTGWRRPTGCSNLQVIFRKRATKFRALLQKMTHKDKASYGSLPPCICST